MSRKEQPQVRFPVFDDAWEQRKLSELAKFNPKSNLPDKFEYVDLESVVGTKLVGHRPEKKDSAPSRAQRLAKKNDVFYQTVRPYQKNNYLFDLPYNNYVFSTGYAQMRPKNNGYFLLSLVQEEKFGNRVLERCTGTSYPAINSNDLAKLSVKVPADTKEQTKIGNFFKKLDETIALQERELALLREQKKGFLQKMFPKEESQFPEVRFPGFTDAWEQRKLGELYKTYSGTTPLRSDASNFENPDVPWIKTTDLRNAAIEYNEENISDKAAKKLKLLRNDTVLIAMYGGFNQIGRTGLLTYPATINQALTALEPINEIIPYFLLTELNYRVNDWKRLAASSRKDPNITKNDVENFKFHFPSWGEQTQIGNFFKKLDETITLQERKLEKLKEVKKGFLQKMFV